MHTNIFAHYRDRGRGIKLRMILLSGLMITLMGCAMTPVKPTKPTIKPIRVDSLVCFTKDDATALGVYILELEK